MANRADEVDSLGPDPGAGDEKELSAHERQQKLAALDKLTAAAEGGRRAASQGINLSLEDLKSLIVTAIAESKKPTEEQVAAKNEEVAKKQKALQQQIELWTAEVTARENAQKSCSHKKPDGWFNYKGQVHGDFPKARVKLFCGTCMKSLVDRPATDQDIQGGPIELQVEFQNAAVMRT